MTQARTNEVILLVTKLTGPMGMAISDAIALPKAAVLQHD